MPTCKIVPSDEALIGMLSAGLNMSRIAKQVGVTRERIRQIYNDRLSSKFGGLTGRELQRTGTLAGRQVQSRETPPASSGVRKIWDLCRSLGLKVTRIPARGEANAHKFATSRLLIAGRRCSVHCAQRLSLPVRGCKRRYFQARSSRWAEAEFTIVVVARDRILVIPQAAPGSRLFYIPERPGLPVYQNNKPRVDWWAYENAWHLLSHPA